MESSLSYRSLPVIPSVIPLYKRLIGNLFPSCRLSAFHYVCLQSQSNECEQTAIVATTILLKLKTLNNTPYKMKKHYNLVFITNMPSFYKIKIWNEVCKEKSVLAIFLMSSDNTRNADFTSGEPKFDYELLDSMGEVKKTFAIIRTLRKIRYDHLVFGVWDNVPSLVIPFVTPPLKNGVICESSIYEYTPNMVKDLIKKSFLKRMSSGFVCGQAQGRLLQQLGFKGNLVYTGGCGLLNYQPQTPFEYRSNVTNFLFVGRLIDVKNLKFLISVFNELPTLTLSIIGFGEQEEELKAMAHSNVHFLGAIPNVELVKYYRSMDVFVLPSKSEPWGLVVEEALNNGLPVIVSNRVGCRDDLVTEKTGLVFDYSSKQSLKDSILKMTDVEYYNSLRNNISSLNFIERGEQQVAAFTNLE